MAEPSRARARLIPIAAVALAALQAALLALTAWDKSDTVDEPLYLRWAVQQWVNGNYGGNCESPALPKWGFALGLRLVDPDLFPASGDVWTAPHPLWSRDYDAMRRNLFAARAATIAMTVAGGLLIFAAAATAFGGGVGLLAQALWCVSPTVLASGSLATLDAWAAALAALTLWGGVRLVRRPGFPWAAVVGAAIGLAGACKATALGMWPVAAAVLVGAAVLRARAGAAGAARVVARGTIGLLGGTLVALWAVYGFSLGSVDTRSLCGRPRSIGDVVLGPLPFPDYVEGLLLQWLHGQRGHKSYLFGDMSSEGWWWFYLAALGLKTTIGAQLIGLVRVASWLKRPPPRRALLADAALLGYPILLLVAMSAGRAQNGIKYLLPAFPFALVWLARALPDAWRAFGRGRTLVLTLAALGAAESLAVHPHHLMFFNLWAGGPAGGPRYLVHGDDWGQDQRRLGEWQRANHVGRLFYTFYNGQPSAWGINHKRPPCEPQPGKYALHAVEVHRPKRIEPGCLDWLTAEPPDERLGWSIYIYRVDEPRIERLRQKRTAGEVFWRSGSVAGGG